MKLELIMVSRSFKVLNVGPKFENIAISDVVSDEQNRLLAETHTRGGQGGIRGHQGASLREYYG